MRNKKIRAMSVGAMIAAVYGALFFIDMNFAGALGYYLFFILPLLIIYYVYQFSFKQALVLGVVIFFITLFTTTPLSLFYSISSIIAGLAIGVAHKKKVSGNIMLLISSGISIANNILLYTVFAKLFDMDLIAEMEEIYELISHFVPLKISLDTFFQYGPLLVLGMGVVEGYLLMMICSLVLPRLKIKFDHRINFLSMRLPKIIGILGALVYIGRFFIQSVYFNYIYLILFALIVLQGFSVIAIYLLSQKKVAIYFIACIGCFIPYLNDFYFIIGIIDIVIGIKMKIMYNVHN